MNRCAKKPANSHWGDSARFLLLSLGFLVPAPERAFLAEPAVAWPPAAPHAAVPTLLLAGYLARPSRRCCSPAPSRGRPISPPHYSVYWWIHTRKFGINIKFQSPSIVKLLEPPFRNYFSFSHRVFQWFSSHFFLKGFWGVIYYIASADFSQRVFKELFDWLQDHKKIKLITRPQEEENWSRGVLWRNLN